MPSIAAPPPPSPLTGIGLGLSADGPYSGPKQWAMEHSLRRNRAWARLRATVGAARVLRQNWTGVLRHDMS